jgi:hypothetical protein
MSLAERKRLSRECEPIPDPDIFDSNVNDPSQFFVCEDGIVKYLYPDYRYHFFKILRNEEKLCKKRERMGGLNYLIAVCYN